MKKIKLLSAFFIMCGLSLTSCSSDDSTPVNNLPANTASFTVTMDGESYVATQATAVQENGTITVKGIRGNEGEMITVKIYATSPGTFTGSEMKYFPSADSEDSYINYSLLAMDTNGSSAITSVSNNTVAGSFSFKGYLNGSGEEIEFTNGQFTNVPLTIIPDPNHTGEGVITAKIDGETTIFEGVNVTYSAGHIILTSQNTETMQSFNLSMPQDITAGSHNLSPNPLTGNTIIMGDGTATVTSVIGGLYISNYANGWISGTFHFTGNDTDGNMVMVTEGEFHAPLN